ncbi:MAG TPA: penicillin-binding protein 1C [Stellaceae bacterium]|jgi:penicillin-binding protein 1C|nr:penicillin-binding protein 1C [Stellaceae bacterium]
MAALGVLVFLAATYLALPLPNLDRGHLVSTLVLARDGSILRGFLSADGKWRLPVSPGEVDPLYLRMLVAAEDKRFGLHPGVDPVAAVRAVGQLVRRGHIVSGASTLPMQAVRLLERRPRTLPAKLTEMGEALALERGVGRDGVLGVYLTLAPFGGNLEGVRAASLAYFGKEPAHLTASEAALLVALPRSPERLRPDRHSEAARAARDAVLARMARQGIISAQILAEAESEAVPAMRLAMPFHAVHLARELANATLAPNIATTIDPALQRQVEAMLKREIGGLDPRASYAAIVVDNRSRDIIAYVGNAEFGSTERRGTIDMARSIRSPGSALKPFIYAMAFDRLIVHPETLVEDRPREFGGYAPGDFDGRFLGTVSAREALQYSLNVPAVAVLDRLGAGKFVSGLAAVGVRLRLPGAAEEPGLAVALGGVGITLSDLATLYTALSHDGKVAPLRTRPDASRETETTLFGPVASWYVTDILRHAPPPPGMLPDETKASRKLAYKTGTSYGYRDAWAVGYDGAVTIAVWAGRPDGTPMPGRSGRVTAAPIVFKIADLLGPAPADAGPGPAPPGALLVGRRDLPPRLRHLDPGPAERGPLANADGPKILYPPDGSTVAWQGGDLPLEARGGTGPLRWLVDGRPLPPAPARHSPTWQPDSMGFARLTVIDSTGKSARATVRLEP